MATPFMVTDDMVEDHYHRWREMLKAVSTHDGMMLLHVKHRSIYVDLADRLGEDEWWMNSPKSDHHPSEYIMYSSMIPDDRILIWTLLRGVVTPRTFFGDAGLGRLTWRPLSNDGIRGWETAVVPEQAAPITFDPNGPSGLLP